MESGGEDLANSGVIVQTQFENLAGNRSEQRE
jgi:hypothetical protein